MFIKVKGINHKWVLINIDKIVLIEEPKQPNERGCTIHLDENSCLRTKSTMAELEMLLDADSVEKRIEALKLENTKLRIQQSTEAATESMVN